jgi:hypothetical protein
MDAARGGLRGAAASGCGIGSDCTLRSGADAVDAGAAAGAEAASCARGRARGEPPCAPKPTSEQGLQMSVRKA